MPFLMNLETLGDQAILIRLGREISLSVHERVIALLHSLDGGRAPWVVDIVPAYATILVIFDPMDVTPEAVKKWILGCARETPGGALVSRTIEIPVLYGGEFGPDLGTVSRMTGLPCEEVIRRHSANEYRVYMLGFKPGFPYLGGLDPALSVSRLSVPRPCVAAGSVAIAGQQAGIYPVDSPGGWRILGRTPVAIFDPHSATPFLLEPGDRVKFSPVDSGGFAKC